MPVDPIPAGYHSLTPYLVVEEAARAIEFYKMAFGAEELLRLEGPGGSVAHAEVKVGDSPLMLADENPEMGFRAPGALGGTPVTLMFYVEDVDQVFAQALEAGATALRPVEDQFYGDRAGTLQDPFGHIWTVATHTEDLTPDQLAERMAEVMSEDDG